MSDLQLEPFAATIVWKLDAPASPDGWINLFESYLEVLGKRGTQNPDTIIGHIKSYAKISEGEFIQISVVSPDRPSTITTQLPNEFLTPSLTLTLNYLVYGLPFDEASQIAQTAANELAAQVGGKAIFSKISTPEQPGHQHE